MYTSIPLQKWGKGLTQRFVEAHVGYLIWHITVQSFSSGWFCVFQSPQPSWKLQTRKHAYELKGDKETMDKSALCIINDSSIQIVWAMCSKRSTKQANPKYMGVPPSFAISLSSLCNLVHRLIFLWILFQEFWLTIGHIFLDASL